MKDRVEREHARYVETTKRGEAQELAMNAAREGCPVIIVGGDGTVNEVVNGILRSGSRVPMSIVGAGSSNDFAWNTVKLPKDPAQSIEKAFHGEVLEYDAGKVNGNYFANSFSVGLDADIAVSADRMKDIPFVKKGEHIGLPEVTCYLARSVSIESEQCVNVQMDGETSHSKRYSVENLPAALLLRA